MKSIRDFDLLGKRVLVRCDFNVSFNEEGFIADDFRIRETLPTIELLRSQKAKIILISHLGEPKGEVVQALKLDKIQEKLAEYLGCSVSKVEDCVGPEVESRVLKMSEGEILLLENVRFHKEEEQNDRGFAKKLSALGDVFCNDAFSVSHRNHASVTGIPEFLPSGIGLLLEKEVRTLSKFLENPLHPFVVIAGGKKVKDKLSFIEHIVDLADFVLLGNLLSEEAKKQNMALQNSKKVIMSVDGGLDIGPKTIQLFIEKIKNAKSIFWTGPLGWVEKKEYRNGSLAIANAIGESKAFAIAGGGDIGSFLDEYNFTEKFSYISTGGGATLEFLAGEQLPGLKVLGYYG